MRKQQAFRATFCGFDPDKVAAFDEMERLLGDAAIVGTLDRDLGPGYTAPSVP